MYMRSRLYGWSYIGHMSYLASKLWEVIKPWITEKQPAITHAPWASYQIRKIAGCACAGNAGNVFPRRRFQREPLVSDSSMHHGTCVTHVPWCMSGSLTCGDGENVPGIPGACAPAILRIWQEAHGKVLNPYICLYTLGKKVVTLYLRQ